MQQLNLPQYNFNLKTENNRLFIRDVIRKKYLLLTPEEWVRQHIIQYLISEKEFPQSLFSVESGIKINTLQKRYDAVVYSRSGKPMVLIECKAPSVPINQKVFEQVTNYNSRVNSPYMLVTNGMQHFFLYLESTSGKFIFTHTVPAFSELA
jgi:hypothetical protein